MTTVEFHEVSKRRAPTERERLTPCECCNYPISHRHHLLSISEFGENEYTVQLCANCHELFHALYYLRTKGRIDEDAYRAGKKKFGQSRALLVWGKYISKNGYGNNVTSRIEELVDKSLQARRNTFEDIRGTNA